ncbi:MAG: hypothetical protein HZA54_07815 [Planctomycetes bacterium]|nr:hypothetical protein [Planctomycetota bacterium]
MVIAKLFTDSGKHPEENLKVMRERYKLAPSLPTYLLVKPNGDLIAAHPGWEPDEEKFLAFLAQAR